MSKSYCTNLENNLFFPNKFNESVLIKNLFLSSVVTNIFNMLTINNASFLGVEYFS